MHLIYLTLSYLGGRAGSWSKGKTLAFTKRGSRVKTEYPETDTEAITERRRNTETS